MLKVKEIGILLSIINHSEIIEEKIKGISKSDFIADNDRIQIACFNILQIGELAKNLDTDFIKKHNRVAWKQIKGMRDKVARGYDSLDIDRIWDTSKNDVPILKQYCLDILKEENISL